MNSKDSRMFLYNLVAMLTFKHVLTIFAKINQQVLRQPDINFFFVAIVTMTIKSMSIIKFRRKKKSILLQSTLTFTRLLKPPPPKKKQKIKKQK